MANDFAGEKVTSEEYLLAVDAAFVRADCPNNSSKTEIIGVEHRAHSVCGIGERLTPDTKFYLAERCRLEVEALKRCRLKSG